MRNKPLLLCFSVFAFFCLMFFPYCYWLRKDDYDFYAVFNRTWGEVIQILAKGRFATQFGGRKVDVEDVPSE